jgi:hypothetical protein
MIYPHRKFLFLKECQDEQEKEGEGQRGHKTSGVPGIQGKGEQEAEEKPYRSSARRYLWKSQGEEFPQTQED